MQRLATARVYGMIEGSRSGYRLTDAAKRYFFPSSDAEKQSALLLLLKSAPIFSEMIKRFDGNKIPPADMLANVLLRDFKIPESWKGRVARFFVKAATDAGLLDSQGFLRYSAARHSLDKMPAPTSNAPSLSTARDTAEGATIPPSSYEAPEGMNAWVFSLKGKTVKVESSDELSDELWKKLNAYIQVLKPFEEETKK